VKPYAVAPEAEDDLRQTWRCLLREAGWRSRTGFRAKPVDAFEGLADVPGKGHKRADLTNRDVLFFSVYQYMIVDRRTELVEIVAVLHGKRDVKWLLKTRK
jgi:plasmid stabilization system protein ParE